MIVDVKTAVVLLNLGGPDSLDAVEPFLNNLFNDPDIIDLPFGSFGRRILAKIISTRRSKKVRHYYELIGGKSPIGDMTSCQASALEKALSGKGDFKVFVAMRYWRPFTHEALEEIRREGIKNVVLLPLYPQYSKTTTGSSLNEWERCVKRMGLSGLSVTKIPRFYDHPGYIGALVEQIEKAAEAFSSRDGIHLIFSAHGVPQKVIDRGDPYEAQIKATVQAVVNRLGSKYPHHLAYQSRVTPEKWLGPLTEEKIVELADQGVKRMLIVPISFVSDHSETLYEINILLRSIAEEHGVKEFVLMPGLNDSPAFIRALADVVLKLYKAI